MSDLINDLNVNLEEHSRTMKKGTILQRPGESVSKSFYVIKGLLRSYTIDNSGKEHTFMFASERWIISDIETHDVTELTILYIECLEDSEIALIDKSKQTLAGFDKEQNAKIIAKLFRRIGALQRRLILMMSATARVRYENFLEIYPELPNRLSQKMIASYIGITPEALSKIRREIVEEK